MKDRVKICLQCKKEFRPKSSKIGTTQWLGRKFCSIKCYGKYNFENGLQRGKNNPRYGVKVLKKTIEKMRSHYGKERYNYKGGYKQRLITNSQYRARRMGNGGSHTLGEWENLKAQYNWTCPCCKKPEPEIKLTEDHIIPLIKGGSNNIENIQPLCKSCNCKKHTKIIKY